MKETTTDMICGLIDIQIAETVQRMARIRARIHAMGNPSDNENVNKIAMLSSKIYELDWSATRLRAMKQMFKLLASVPGSEE